MRGKTALITGGNAGLGQATALALARLGATVIIAARDEARGRAAAEAINRKAGAMPVRPLLLDLARLGSVRDAAERFLSEHSRLDVLVNNAGVFAARLEQTQDGFELQFGVNHLGPFLLSHLLLPALKAAPEPRLINVASRAHYAGRIDFDDLRGEKPPYRGWAAYARSKLANVLFTREWTRRFPDIPANCLHPGTVRTAIGNKHGPWYVSLAWSLVKPFLASPERGAATAVHLASAPAIAGIGGRYFDPWQRERRPSPLALDDGLARRLWEVSEQLTADWRLPPLGSKALR
ncbi:MAG: SDR family oxidoreductase [Candidatus Competibacter sp.]|nr:SDR family oxidoreductase [Candidatus Competibacter sp.]